MKKILLLYVCCLSGCFLFSEQETTKPVMYTPKIVQEKVGCCITDQQVHGAIYSALLKLKWNIENKSDNSFNTYIRCGYENIDIIFNNTDKEYFISYGQLEYDEKYEYCIRSYTNKINKYIKIYLKKAIAKAARKELNGIK